MSRLTDRLERDLAEIAGRAAPSPAAWDTIRRRIGTPEDEMETKIVMLSPEAGVRDHRRRAWLVAGAAALLAILAIGLALAQRPDDDPPVTPVPPPTTTVPEPEYLGIVWESVDDPGRVNATEGRPELVDGPLSARLGMFVLTPGPEESAVCAAAVAEGAIGPGGEPRELPDVESCLIVEWHFDIGEEAPRNGGMDARDGVTVDGEPVAPLVYDFPVTPPGGSATTSVVYPNLGPGAQISIGYEVWLADGGISFERWDIVVPDTFQPIDWFDDEG